MGEKTSYAGEDLDQWIRAASKELNELDQRLAPLIEKQVTLKERLRLLERLKETFAGPTHQTASSSEPSPSATTLEAAAEEILRRTGRPMHVSRLRRELVKNGITIPGQGLDANVISRLARCPRFVRVARGTYALADGAH